MRILRVVHKLYPPTVGGLSFYAHLLSVEQAKLGHEVVVLTTQEPGYSKYEYKNGYEIYRFKALARPLGNPITLSLLPPLLLRHDFDILQAHSHLMFTTNLAALKRRSSTTPFVITNHGFRVERGKLLDFAQRAYLSSIGRFTLSAADRVISFTETERMKTISAGVTPSSAVVIPNGVNTKFFRPLDVDVIPHSVFWTGRYVPEKGVRYLLKAARIVTADIPNSKFILVGYGEEFSKQVELRDALGLRANVLMFGALNQRRILSLLNRCTLFALPSLSEGFPSTVLEAMACGKPLVVTAGIGLEEVVGDAGLYAPPRDTNALAKAIEKLLRNEYLANELGKRGRKRTVTYYDWSKVVSRVNRLFEGITNGE